MSVTSCDILPLLCIIWWVFQPILGTLN